MKISQVLVTLLLIVILLPLSLSAQGSSVTLITANLQHGEGTDDAFDFSRQVAALAGADILLIQERTTDETGWNAPMASAGLVEAIWRENAPAPHQGDGPAIWYKSATVTVLETWFRDLVTGTNPGCGTPDLGDDCSTDVSKAAVAAKVQYGRHQFYVVSTHLCWSLCNDSSGVTTSAQRESQINDLLSWVASITGGDPNVIIGGDMNFAPDSPKIGGGVQKDLMTASYTDLWNAGIASGQASAPWDDRDGVGGVDMPVTDLGTRTHDTRRIDYFFLKTTANNLRLNAITMPESRATCSEALTLTGTYKECPDVSQLWDVPDDQGVRVSDHNFIKLTLSLPGKVRGRVVKSGAVRIS